MKQLVLRNSKNVKFGNLIPQVELYVRHEFNDKTLVHALRLRLMQ